MGKNNFGISASNIHKYLNKGEYLQQEGNREDNEEYLPRMKNQNFDPSNYGHLGLDERKAIIYKTLFDSFTTTKKSYMSPSELRNVFVYLGIYTNKKEIFSFLSDFDSKEHGYLDFEDFVRVLTDRNKAFEKDTKRKKMEIFR